MVPLTRDFFFFFNICASLVAQMVSNLPAMQEIQVQSLGQEDPLEKEMAIFIQFSRSVMSTSL